MRSLWPARDGDIVQTRGRECLIQRRRDVGSAHGGAEPPGHDVAREVVQHEAR